MLGGQINTTVTSISIGAANFNGLIVIGTLFIQGQNGTGVVVQGTQWKIALCIFSGQSVTGSIGVNVTSNFAQGGEIKSNQFQVFGIAILVAAASKSPVDIAMNKMIQNTNDYQVANGAAAVVITDRNPRTYNGLIGMLAANSGITGSEFYVTDAAGSGGASSAPTYLGPVGGGGTNPITVRANAASPPFYAAPDLARSIDLGLRDINHAARLASAGPGFFAS